MEQENRVELVKKIISICHHLSMDIVAEGIEHKQQAELLLSLGCETFQGFHFCRPIDGQSITDWSYSGND